MSDEIKTRPAVVNTQLVAQPQLIRVHTISPKIVEQLDRLDGEHQTHVVDWAGVEIIGRIGWRLIVRVLRSKDLAIVHVHTYHEDLRAAGLTQPEIAEKIAALTQLFQA